MAQRTWEEKEKAYQAKHNACLEAWEKKDAAFKGKEKKELRACMKSYQGRR